MQGWVIRIGCGVAWWSLVCAGGRAQETKPPTPLALPAYRVETDGFEASSADIRAVLDSAARELWRFFPDYKLEPLVVARGRSGPITLYQRNERGEIVMRLDTEKTYWSQYAYQFSHEFCHVLCGFKAGNQGNRWFEETLCETASLFTMRAMSRSWKNSPPYAHWKDYRDALRDYVDDITRRRVQVHEIYARGLREFYTAHRVELEKDPTSRELNGAMSLVFLQLFEEQPERWEAVRWLNRTPAGEGDSFQVYLQKWQAAAPPKHQVFVKQIADLYGVTLPANAAPEAVAAAEKPAARDQAHPRLRVQAAGFQASEQDIQAVLNSASRELWQYFPGHQIDPLLVVRGRSGPTVLYARNPQGELVLQLDTEKTFWCQYANQFSFLFAEVLCGFSEQSVGNKWFEVSVCEAAAAFTLRQMSRSWEQAPPYPNWKDYRHALAKYVEEAWSQRPSLAPEGLREFYRQHREELARTPDSRPLSQAVAVALLKLFEERPEHWEAIRWLNSTPSPKGETFDKYLQRWHAAVPPKHRPFVQRISELFGVPIKAG